MAIKCQQNASSLVLAVTSSHIIHIFLLFSRRFKDTYNENIKCGSHLPVKIV